MNLKFSENKNGQEMAKFRSLELEEISSDFN